MSFVGHLWDTVPCWQMAPIPKHREVRMSQLASCAGHKLKLSLGTQLLLAPFIVFGIAQGQGKVICVPDSARTAVVHPAVVQGCKGEDFMHTHNLHNCGTFNLLFAVVSNMLATWGYLAWAMWLFDRLSVTRSLSWLLLQSWLNIMALEWQIPCEGRFTHTLAFRFTLEMIHFLLMFWRSLCCIAWMSDP